MQITKKTSSGRVGKRQVLAWYEQTLTNPNNYIRIARRYLEFIMEKGFTIDEISMNLFVGGKAPSYVSGCRKFVKFALQEGIESVYEDRTPALKGDPTILLYLAHAQLSQESKETYAKALQEFVKFADSESLPLSRPLVLRYLEKLKKERKSAHTINTYLAIIKQYALFCATQRKDLGLTDAQAQQIRDISLIRSLKLGGTQRTYSKDSLSEKERDQLLDVAILPRDRALLSLMAWQGLRTVEVLRLSWSDLIEKEGRYTLRVWGKGRNEKEEIPLLSMCLKCLLEYKKEQQGNLAMFPFRSTGKIRALTNHYLIKAGLKRERISAHSLRHTAAQILIKKGIPKAMVQRLLRHRSEATTSLYTRKEEDYAFTVFDFDIFK